MIIDDIRDLNSSINDHLLRTRVRRKGWIAKDPPDAPKAFGHASSIEDWRDGSNDAWHDEKQLIKGPWPDCRLRLFTFLRRCIVQKKNDATRAREFMHMWYMWGINYKFTCPRCGLQSSSRKRSYSSTILMVLILGSRIDDNYDRNFHSSLKNRLYRIYPAIVFNLGRLDTDRKRNKFNDQLNRREGRVHVRSICSMYFEWQKPVKPIVFWVTAYFFVVGRIFKQKSKVHADFKGTLTRDFTVILPWNLYMRLRTSCNRKENARAHRILYFKTILRIINVFNSLFSVLHSINMINCRYTRLNFRFFFYQDMKCEVVLRNNFSYISENNNREIYSDMLSECGSELSITVQMLNNSRCHRTRKILRELAKCILKKSRQLNERKCHVI